MTNKSIIWLIFSTVTILLIVIFLVLNNSQTSKTDKSKDFKEVPSIINQPILGSEDSPITVVEFGDYKCPACNNWKDNIFEKLNNDYIRVGKVKFSYINVLFHGNESIIASLSAEYINKHYPEKYWEFHKNLYTNQKEEFTIEEIVNLAKNIEGIDVEGLRQALVETTMEPQLQKDIELVNKFEIQQTPTIFINNIKITDPFDYSLISNTIEKELGKEYE